MHDRLLHIGDVTLRDGHQSLLATRLRTSDMVDALEAVERAGYESVEAWGGATFDAALRFGNEDPWARLSVFRWGLPSQRLRMLLRGQNLVGYRHYADDVVDLFVARAAIAGIDRFRVFDALNDVRNLERSIAAVLRHGKEVEGAICYTTSPVHTPESFVAVGRRLAELGATALCIKDMAGLLTPTAAFDLVRALRRGVGLPIVIHTHATNGFAETTCLAAAEAGAFSLDGAVGPLAGGSSLPAVETLAVVAEAAGRTVRLDLDAVERQAAHFRAVRDRYREVDTGRTGIDGRVLRSQIPGGMLSNLSAQLKELGAAGRMAEVLDEIPRVRAEMGYPPLVTPTSQIVGYQRRRRHALRRRHRRDARLLPRPVRPPARADGRGAPRPDRRRRGSDRGASRGSARARAARGACRVRRAAADRRGAADAGSLPQCRPAVPRAAARGAPPRRREVRRRRTRLLRHGVGRHRRSVPV
jgi:pyruvate carboxylase subunit B